MELWEVCELPILVERLFSHRLPNLFCKRLVSTFHPTKSALSANLVEDISSSYIISGTAKYDYVASSASVACETSFFFFFSNLS